MTAGASARPSSKDRRSVRNSVMARHSVARHVRARFLKCLPMLLRLPDKWQEWTNPFSHPSGRLGSCHVSFCGKTLIPTLSRGEQRRVGERGATVDAGARAFFWRLATYIGPRISVARRRIELFIMRTKHLPEGEPQAIIVDGHLIVTAAVFERAAAA